GASQIGLTVTFLAHQTWLLSDAILRTLGRLLVTRRHLLEWVTAAQAKDAYAFKMFGMYRRMAGGIVLAAGASVLLAYGQLRAWPAAVPFILFWAAAPAIARWISLPPRLSGADPLSAVDSRVLRLTARRTWRFF